MEKLYEIARNSGRFLYELARADLAYLVTTIALPVTMSLDLINLKSDRNKNKVMRRSLTLSEGALKFAEGKNNQ